jgi:diketogulonate reductase-like aldo/keto reductase
MVRLTDLMAKYDIKVQAYGPQAPLFRAPGGPSDAVVDKIAKETGFTPGQIYLKWVEQYTKGVVVT